VDASLPARLSADEHGANVEATRLEPDMVLAADYPFLNIFWSMIIFFAWVCWIWMMVSILGDVFRRRDISGWGKAGWSVVLIAIPFLGALTYLIANGDDMAQRNVEQVQTRQAEFDEYVQSVATKSGGGAAGEIDRAKSLLDSGAITQSEFDALKVKVLA
jgi:hypothetical protein